MNERRTGPGGAAGLWLAVGASVVIVGAAAWFNLNRQTDVSQSALVPQQQPPGTPAPVAEPATAAAPTADGDAAGQSNVESTQAAAPAPRETTDLSAPTATETQTDTVALTQEAAAAVQPFAPAFDEVRRETDGMTIIAGRATPGATLRVLQDGTEVAGLTADASGKFATFLMIPPDGQGHVLSLEQIQDGVITPSDDQIILAPLSVAKAPPEPVADPEPVAEAQMQAEAGAAEDADAAPETATAVAPSQAPLDDTDEDPQPSFAEAPAAPTTDLALLDPDADALPSAEPATPAPASSGVVLKSTSDGVEVLNTPAPEVMKRVALDTISYSDVGDVQLSGRAQSQTEAVRVYLNNAPVASLPVDAAGRWRGDLPDIDEGIYTLRVDEVAEDGTVTSRVETPFKRENPAALAQAALGQEGPLKRITVQKGNTLWAIARERYGDGLLFVRVFEANANDIRDPDLIYPGQVFDLPD